MSKVCNNFLGTKTSSEGENEKIVYFVFFFWFKISSWKNRVCLDSLNYYTTDVISPTPTLNASTNFSPPCLFACTYFYLWESLLIHDHLWISFLFLRESLFVNDHLWKSLLFGKNHFESFLFVIISSYIWSSVRISSQIWPSFRTSFCFLQALWK